jgi:hypothetical protein
MPWASVVSRCAAVRRETPGMIERPLARQRAVRAGLAVALIAGIAGCSQGAAEGSDGWTFGPTLAPASGEPTTDGSEASAAPASAPVGSSAPVASPGPETSQAP